MDGGSWYRDVSALTGLRATAQCTVTGEQIIVAPIRIEGNQARIGIKASRRFEILRREVLERQTVPEPA